MERCVAVGCLVRIQRLSGHTNLGDLAVGWLQWHRFAGIDHVPKASIVEHVFLDDPLCGQSQSPCVARALARRWHMSSAESIDFRKRAFSAHFVINLKAHTWL